MTRHLAVALAAAALGLTACGEGEDDENAVAPTTPAATTETNTPEREALSLDAYRDELREQCETAEEQAERIPEPADPSPAALGAYFERAADFSRRYQEEFEALVPPEELADDHDAAVRLGEANLELLDEVSESLSDGGDPQRVLGELLPRLNAAIEESNAYAEQIDVEECVQDPIPLGPTQES